MGNTVNENKAAWAPSELNEELDVPDYEPEDCDECGCTAGEFEDADWDNGHYRCPQCGAVC